MEKNNTNNKNLLILGVISVAIAMMTTGVSLYIYHKSGDIYIDRSRPGFLPEKGEEKPIAEEYKFNDSGIVTEEVLDEYLKHFDKITEELEAFTDPFSAKTISDETLNILP